MDVRFALKRQFLGSLAMLRQCIERCPEAVWEAGPHPRNFWRIAYHAIFYADLYMQQSVELHRAWPKSDETARVLWEEPPVIPAYSKADLLDYLDQVMQAVSPTVDGLDLEREETGFDWYPNMSKIEHLLVNLRHIQGHVGQLSERLIAEGVDVDWVARRDP